MKRTLVPMGTNGNRVVHTLPAADLHYRRAPYGLTTRPASIDGSRPLAVRDHRLLSGPPVYRMNPISDLLWPSLRAEAVLNAARPLANSTYQVRASLGMSSATSRPAFLSLP
jgi:hypothetical protein